MNDAKMPFRPHGLIEPLAETQENRDYWMERAVAAERERDQARQMLAFDWNRLAAPNGVDLVAAYQAWLDWYNADKQDEEDTPSHELAREYVLSLITELRQARQDLAGAGPDAKTMELLWQQEVRNHDSTRRMLADAPHAASCVGIGFRFEDRDQVEGCSCWKAGL